MKAISRILQTTGFIATFVAFTYSFTYTIDAGTCKRIVIGPIGWLGPIAMMVLVLGFGAASRNEFSKRGQLAFWLFSTVFLGAQATFLSFNNYGSFSRKWLNLSTVFAPELRIGHALEALAAFYVDVVHYWMPVASVASLVVFAITLITGGSCWKSSRQATEAS